MASLWRWMRVFGAARGENWLRLVFFLLGKSGVAKSESGMRAWMREG